ncbi:MAG: 50S ribosomal protein L17 [Spirochaetales bacterium]
MKHRVGFNRLGRKPAHRKALHRNMVTSLFRYERIRTTKAKASAIRRTAEKMITRAKVDSVHNRRMIARDIKDKAILAKLFTDIGPRFEARPGGYTRMLKIGQRRGDASDMVLLELVEEEFESKGKSKPEAKTAKPGAKKGRSAESKKADSARAESKKTAEAKSEESATNDEAEADSSGETDDATTESENSEEE